MMSPKPSPSPTPPPLETVVGATQVETLDARVPGPLGFADDGPPSHGAVDATVADLAAALDGFLNSAQVNEADLKPIRGVWLENVDPDAAEVLRTGITNRDNPVAAATYRMVIQLEPDPTIVATTVSVERRDGSVVSVEMVFDVSGEAPLLHLVGGLEAA